MLFAIFEELDLAQGFNEHFDILWLSLDDGNRQDCLYRLSFLIQHDQVRAPFSTLFLYDIASRWLWIWTWEYDPAFSSLFDNLIDHMQLKRVRSLGFSNLMSASLLLVTF